jgi:N-acetyl-D-muramate 6-phosphate phosphatase
MPLNTSLIRAICFDIDGTLSDTDNLWLQKTLPFIRPFNRVFPRMEPNRVARRLIMSLETPGNYMYYLLDRAGMDATAGRIYNWINKSVLYPRKKNFMIVPGAKQAVETLGRQFPLAVVSSRDRAGIMGFLENFELSPQFKAVATSQTCKYTKPFPHPIIWAASQMGVAPEECLMVGDTVVDIKAGKAAGAQTVGVLCGFGDEQELRKAGADMILPGPSDLLTYLHPEAA